MKRTATLIVALLALAAGTAHAAFPGRNGAIVYGYVDGSYGWDDQLGSEANFVEKSIRVRTGRDESRFLTGCTEVYLSDSACDRKSFSDPALSPDGERVALDAGASLALVNFDASDFHLLPAHGQDDGTPAFSPNGSQLAFGSGAPFRYGQPSHRSVWIGDADGADARRLVEGDAPAWSSRSWIAFVRQRTVYRIRPDGRGLKLLARNSVAPEWSPDGRRLAVSSSGVRNRGTRRMIRRAGVIVMDADGARAHLLRADGATESPNEIAWSPDGRRLLILSDDLMTIDLRGRLVGDLGESYYDGAEDVWEMNGIAWQPLPR
ncbi:MAG: TolB family protein [Conexibacter sp.]